MCGSDVDEDRCDTLGCSLSKSAESWKVLPLCETCHESGQQLVQNVVPKTKRVANQHALAAKHTAKAAVRSARDSPETSVEISDDDVEESSEVIECGPSDARASGSGAYALRCNVRRRCD